MYNNKNPNKEEPEALLKLVLEDFLELLNSPDQENLSILIQHIKKISSLQNVHFHCDYWTGFFKCEISSVLVQHVKERHPKTSRESQNAVLRTSHRLSMCKVVFLLKDVTITTITTVTISTVTITTITITTVTIITVTITSVGLF